MTQPKVPITRLNKFFSDQDFDLDISMGMEWLHGDMNFTLVLYRIDRQKTNYDDIYGETLQDEIRFKPPIELKVLVSIEDNGPKSYNPNGTLFYEDYGNLTFYVYKKQLEEKKCDIELGDFVGYADSETNVKYYKVVDPNRIDAETEKTRGGYKTFYNKILCTPVDLTEFRGF